MNNEKEMNNKIAQHESICKTLTSTYTQKNRAYGDSFQETFNEFGAIASVIRLTDKLRRLKTLVQSPTINTGDESIKDTLLDMANYCIMTYMSYVNASTATECKINSTTQLANTTTLRKDSYEHN